jgi:LCP family protein required for cell wall assembly
MSARESDKDASRSVVKRRRYRRTWPQRLSLCVSSLTSVACLTSAGGVWYANHQLGQLQRVDITHITPADALAAGGTTATTLPGQPATTTEPEAPIIDVKAQNFLVVGSDSRGCISPDSPYYGGLYDGTETGTNSDTIMLIRADPSTSQAAILSFPRDLWVKLADGNNSGKINSVFQNANPSRLVRTIELNFQLKVDHYINVDFCAFKDIVDAVGGVAIPFTFPARDIHTGLEILQTGCHTFAGDEALAYARSRYYEWFNSERWISDETSDFGRIARQQDFVKRAIAKAIDKGVSRPSVAQKLLNAAITRVKVDRDLTPNDMLTLASKLKGFDPTKVRSYRIEGSGGDPIYIDTNSGTNRGILKVFRGQARLKDAPDPATLGAGSSTSVNATTTTTVAATTTTSRTSTSGSGSPVDSTTSTTAVVEVKENTVGISPPKDVSCR